MYEVFNQRQAGRLGLSEGLIVSPQMASYDLGTLAWPIGTVIACSLRPSSGAFARQAMRKLFAAASLLTRRAVSSSPPTPARSTSR